MLKQSLDDANQRVDWARGLAEKGATVHGRKCTDIPAPMARADSSGAHRPDGIGAKGPVKGPAPPDVFSGVERDVAMVNRKLGERPRAQIMRRRGDSGDCEMAKTSSMA